MNASATNPLVYPWDEANRRLEANVRPADWRNPDPAGRYHLVVVGAGSAGLVTAMGAAGLGARVALVERNRLGGDCLNTGCVPSKALLRAARARVEVRDAGRFHVEVPEGTRIDFAGVMERMRRLRADISRHDSARRFQEAGVDVFFGEGRFRGPDRLEVDGLGLRFRRAVIATGSRPAALPVEGLAEAGYLTNESLFSLTELPPRLAVFGGGPIGAEMAQAFCRFGAEVHLVESSDRILNRDDPEAAAVVADAMRRDGVVLHLEAELCEVEHRPEGKALHIVTGRRRESVMVDEILLAVGRRPNVEGLGLEAAGVRYDRRGVEVDDFLRTSNLRIYAAGDICLPYKFTHTADASARMVIQNALFGGWNLLMGGRRRVSRMTIPWCTYTDPELAHVGLSESEAHARGIPVQAFVQKLDGVDRAVLEGEPEGMVKVVVRLGTDRIVGATIVSRHAGEMIGELSVAMAAGMGLGRLAQVIHPYPTQAEAVRRCADAFNRTRLTPGRQRVLRQWMHWSR